VSGEPRANGNEAEHGTEQEVKEIVASIQRGETNCKGSYSEG
jgi:hypothetical protein